MNDSMSGCQEQEEDEHFYESLDQILLDETDEEIGEEDPSVSPSMYEVWVTEPSSIQERRSLLLYQMGLADDITLSRIKPSVTNVPTLASDQCKSTPSFKNNSVDVTDSKPLRQRKNNCNLSIILPSLPILSIDNNSIHSLQLDENDYYSVSVSPVHSFHSLPHGNMGPFLTARSSPNKASITEPVEETICFHHQNPNHESSSVLIPQYNSDKDDSNSREIVGDHARLCTIKNLDNGKEFVVNEFGENGMWNKLREVSTGRQLTMEEFQLSVGHSPIVQELMRRQNVEESSSKMKDEPDSNGTSMGSKMKKKGGWFKSLKNVACNVTSNMEKRSSDERDSSSDRGGRRSSSATDDSQDIVVPERMRVRQYGKSHKELSALYMSQEIQGHTGSIWSIKFSLDGRYLASAGEDHVIHVWQVVESERKSDLLMGKQEDGNISPYLSVMGSPEIPLETSNLDNNIDRKKRGKLHNSKKVTNWDHVFVPEKVFTISDKPICSFLGHLRDVLDLSWSKSQYLLSSSMDKTVRLWHLSSLSCLKVFSHNDYVTCIQFNPVDEQYFISGSLDAKVRVWSIPERKVVDWTDLHEMVTSACYTPDGKGALVGSHKGNCYLYDASENKLHQKSRINLQNKKRNSHAKKITGFQFVPGSSSEVLITSADSRIRIIDDVDLVHKFKGFRNRSSQISANITSDGKYVICASEDSHVYVWRYDGDSRPTRSKSITVTWSYEHFHCNGVSVAIPWQGIKNREIYEPSQNLGSSLRDVEDQATLSNPWVRVEVATCQDHPRSLQQNSHFYDRVSATWPEEKLLTNNGSTQKRNCQRSSSDFFNGEARVRSAWGVVIVTAGIDGKVKVFQNFGLPVRI